MSRRKRSGGGVEPAETGGPSARRLALVSLTVALLLVLGASIKVRFDQYAAWRSEPARHFADGKPLMSSVDAYYWLRLAEEYRNGEFAASETDPLMSFPDGAPRPRLIPLLSYLMARVAGLAGVDVYRAGIAIVPFLAGLFVLPLVAYARRLDLDGAGLLAGLITGFGYAYFTRTSIGSVDTDALNLFFPLLGSLCILYACEAPSQRKRLVWSAAAGITLLLFHWWYLHPAFAVVYLGLLVVCLASYRVDRKTIAAAAGLFVVCANPLYVWRGFGGLVKFASLYLLPDAGRGDAIALPNVIPTTTEAQREALGALALVLEPSWLTLGGLLLFVVAAVSRWKRLLPLLPLAALGLLAFTTGRRFAMFLAPFVGLGYGWLLCLLLDRVFERLRLAATWRKPVAHAAALIAFLPLLPATSIDFVPSPNLSSGTISTIAGLRERLPRSAPVLSWWDYGYALAAVGGFATFHDGAYHEINTYLIARTLSGTSPRELYAATSFINDHGAEGIDAMLADSPAPRRFLDDAVGYGEGLSRDDVHLLLMQAMISKYAAIHYLGNWDFDRGTGSADGYQRVRCSQWQQNRIVCDSMTIDTQSGYIRDDLTLEKLVVIHEGRVAQEVDYPRDTDVILQIVTSERGVVGLYLLTERVFDSNFNQMYFLGRHDPELYERVHDDFPAARVYRLRRLP